MLSFEKGVQKGHVLLPYSIFLRIVFPFALHDNNRVTNTYPTGIGHFVSKIEAKFNALRKIFILLYLHYFLICTLRKGSC
jgi:hypothetical protein